MRVGHALGIAVAGYAQVLSVDGVPKGFSVNRGSSCYSAAVANEAGVVIDGLGLQFGDRSYRKVKTENPRQPEANRQNAESAAIIQICGAH